MWWQKWWPFSTSIAICAHRSHNQLPAAEPKLLLSLPRWWGGGARGRETTRAQSYHSRKGPLAPPHPGTSQAPLLPRPLSLVSQSNALGGRGLKSVVRHDQRHSNSVSLTLVPDLIPLSLRDRGESRQTWGLWLYTMEASHSTLDAPVYN